LKAVPSKYNAIHYLRSKYTVSKINKNYILVTEQLFSGSTKICTCLSGQHTLGMFLEKWEGIMDTRACN
jgi:hypothetical protein